MTWLFLPHITEISSMSFDLNQSFPFNAEYSYST